MNAAFKFTGKPSTPVFWILLLCFIGSCSLFNGDNKEPINLEGTQWKLKSIEAIDDTVFNEYPNGTWIVPENQIYTVEFMENGEVAGVDNCGDCTGNYKMRSQDSISITYSCPLDVVCGKNIDYQDRINNSRTFKVAKESLKLFYEVLHRTYSMNGTLHFSRVNEVDEEN